MERRAAAGAWETQGKGEGWAGAGVRLEEVGRVWQMKENASQTVLGYRDNWMVVSVYPRKHPIQSIQSLREGLGSGTATETPPSKQHSCRRPGGQVSDILGCYHQVRSLHAAGALGKGPPAFCSRPGPVVPGPAARAFSLGLPRRRLPLFCRWRPPSFVLNLKMCSRDKPQENGCCLLTSTIRNCWKMEKTGNDKCFQ